MNITPIPPSDTALAVRKEYYTNTLGKIKKRWKGFQTVNSEILNQERHSQKNIPWFGDISSWWSDVKKHTNPFVYRELPRNIQENLGEISCELDSLLPQTTLTSSFLPVLLTCYTLNRRKKGLFFNRIDTFDGNADDWDAIIDYELGVFSVSTVMDQYKKLTAQDISLSDAKRARAVFSNVILFFVYLINTSELCNISLSFYTFQCMTGYLAFLGDEALDLCDEFDQQDPSSVLLINNALDKKILRYAKSILRDYYLFRIPHRQECGDVKITAQYPASFLLFLTNLQDTLQACRQNPGSDNDENVDTVTQFPELTPLEKVELLHDMRYTATQTSDGLFEQILSEAKKSPGGEDVLYDALNLEKPEENSMESSMNDQL